MESGPHDSWYFHLRQLRSPQVGKTNKKTMCFMKAKQEFSYLSRTITSRVEVNILSFLAEQAKSFLGRITFIIIFELELSHVVEQLGQMAADLSSR